VIPDSKNPIGIFDSGVGGLTVFKEVKKVLPNESLIYLGDTARVPYGTKSAAVVTKYSLTNVNLLLSMGAKAVVVACNTASSAAVSYLEKVFPNCMIIGVIEPVVEYLLHHSEFKKIAVIGTNTTIASEAYQNALKRGSADLEIVAKGCPLFVPLVEEGLFSSKITELTVDMYLSEIKRKKPDALILGCTHYPMLKEIISDYFGGSVQIFDTGYFTAKKLAAVLAGKHAENTSPRVDDDSFFVTDDADSFCRTAELFLGYRIFNVSRV
jgi:glutamate racemase